MRLGPALAGGLATLLVSLACREADLGAAEAVRALGVLALLVLPVGDLLLGWARAAGLSVTERVFLAAGIGWPAASGLHYVLSLLGLGAAFPFTAIPAWGLWWRFRRRSTTAHAVGAPWDGLLLVAVGLALLATLRGNAPFTPVAGGLAYDHNQDSLVHGAIAWELLRGVPPQQHPLLAGEPFYPYHVFPYLPWVWVVRYAGLGVLATYHAVLPVFYFGLLAGGLYVAVRVRTEDRRIALAAVAALFFVTAVLEQVFHHRLVGGLTTLEYALRTPSGSSGLAVWAAIFALLSLFDAARRRGEGGQRILYLAAGLVGLSYFVKAQAFLLLGAAFLAALALLVLRDRSRDLLLAGLLVAVVAGALVLSWRSPQDFRSLEWQPGTFAEEVVFPWLRRDPLPLVREGLGPALEASSWGWIAATALGIWRLANLSVLVPGFLVSRLRRFRDVGLGDATAALVLPSGFLMACGLGASEFASGAQLARQALYAVPVVATALDVCVLGHLARRAGLDGGRSALGIVALAALALAPTLVRSPVHEKDGAQLVLGPDEQKALLYLRDDTPPDAVVLSARTRSFSTLYDTYGDWERYAVVGGIAGRRSVLEYFVGRISVPERRKHKLRVFETTEEAVARRILRHYAVDYVLEYGGRPLAFQPRILALCLDAGRVRVWGVHGCAPPRVAAADLR